MGLPGPRVPPPGRDRVTSRGEAASDCPGFQQARRPGLHRPGLGFLWRQHRTPDACAGRCEGCNRGHLPSGWSPRSRCWGPAPAAGSVVSWFQVSLCPFLSLLSPGLLPMRTAPPHIEVSDLISTWTALQWPICTQSPILRSWEVQVPAPLEVTSPGGQHSLWGCGGGRGAGFQGRNPEASWRKQCPDSGRTDGQAEAGGRPSRGPPLPSGW